VANTPASALVCFPIPVPRGDPAFNRDCISFVRSLGGISTDCQAGPLEQVLGFPFWKGAEALQLFSSQTNQVTHFLDGSQIYGSDSFTNSGLRRARVRGMLDFQFPTPNGMLPPIDPSGKNELLTGEKTQFPSGCLDGERSFVSGDSRANQQPFLTLQHIIWFREHNRIALQLSVLNRGWTDSKIFEVSLALSRLTFRHQCRLLFDLRKPEE
jgi:peroxidase